MDLYFIPILIIIASILLSGFFSGMEIAYISVNRLRLELEKKQNTFTSRIIRILSKSPSQFITTMLVGNNITLVIYSLFMGNLIIKLLFPSHFDSESYSSLLIQTLISTFFILILAEFIPKALFRINPKYTLLFFAFPAFLFYILFYPITKITILFSRLFINNFFKFKFKKTEETKVFGKTDLTALFESEQSYISGENKFVRKPEIAYLKNVLDFSEIKIRECMIPRTEIVAIEENDTIDNLKKKFTKSGFSRIIVYQKNIENIVGYVHSFELFKKPNKIKALLTSIPIVPESMQANKLLTILSDINKGIALVVDEFGGTAGIVTVEDILEEIVGEIEDEYDTKPNIDEKISSNEYIFSARQEIDFINEKYNLDLPKNEDFETIAGLILVLNKAIPKKNENIVIPDRNMSFKILEATEKKIEKVLLEIHSKKKFNPNN